jgi:hypothetical protein
MFLISSARPSSEAGDADGAADDLAAVSLKD